MPLYVSELCAAVRCGGQTEKSHYSLASVQRCLVWSIPMCAGFAMCAQSGYILFGPRAIDRREDQPNNLNRCRGRRSTTTTTTGPDSPVIASSAVSPLTTSWTFPIRGPPPFFNLRTLPRFDLPISTTTTRREPIVASNLFGFGAGAFLPVFDSIALSMFPPFLIGDWANQTDRRLVGYKIIKPS